MLLASSCPPGLLPAPWRSFLPCLTELELVKNGKASGFVCSAVKGPNGNHHAHRVCVYGMNRRTGACSLASQSLRELKGTADVETLRIVSKSHQAQG